MRKLLQFLLYRPIHWIVESFSSAPDKERVFSSLSSLLQKVKTTAGKKGFVIPFELSAGKFVIFSDQHKGRRNGADDFLNAEQNYLAALKYYDEQRFHLIALGDSEELWENTLLQVRKHNKATFEAEAAFLKRNAFTKIFGNHDLDWDVDPLAPVYLKELYGSEVIALEAVLLQTKVGGRSLDIFCTHGHQGDLQSDGNWFSKFFVAKIWAPLQAYLEINPNTPSYDKLLKTVHNNMMYEWSAQQQDTLLITGHTHQPVFASLTHVERLEVQHRRALIEHNRVWAEAIEAEMSWRRKDELDIRQEYYKLKPCYFNSGCCCFADGDISGIEISEGNIRLIKWKRNSGNGSVRTVLEEKSLAGIASNLTVIKQ